MKTRNIMTAMRAITTPTSARGDKTYNSDLLQKRSHVFTEEKPFTPRTLKTKNRSSKLVLSVSWLCFRTTVGSIYTTALRS
jgi:hypothetical protein